MAYIESDIPDAPDRLSLLDRTAYELLRSRLREDDDPGEALEKAPPEAIEAWLLEQAESLGDMFRLHANHFEPSPFVQ